MGEKRRIGRRETMLCGLMCMVDVCVDGLC